MKLSLKVEYACRVMARMAVAHQSGQLAHIESLSEEESIPKNYLVQILSELRNGGLISSRRGKQGGYSLVRDPDAITLHEIIEVVDAELLEVRFNTEGKSGQQVAQVWSEISDVLDKKTREYNLLSFVPKESGEMYFI